MSDKNVVLIRKQSTPFTVNFPSDGGVKSYVWMGTQGRVLNERPVPYEVFEWLQNYTSTFTEGCLIIKETDDEDVKMVKENIPEIEKVEESILTKQEIEELLNNGNHLTLKKKLNELVKDKSEAIVENIKRNVIGVATEIGIDSNAKREVLCTWAGLEYENSDLIFDKHLKELYEK